MLDWEEPFHRDATLLIMILFVGSMSTGFLTNGLILPAWERGRLLQAFYQTGVAIFGEPSLLNAAMIGCVGGLLLTWLFDTYKQIQIFIPVAIVGAFLISWGFSVASFLSKSLSLKGVIVITFTVLVSQLTGLQWDNLFNNKPVRDSVPRDYRKAPLFVFLGVGGLIGISLFDVYGSVLLSGSIEFSNLVRDGFVGGILIGILGWVTIYNNDIRMIQIGPGKAGKTAVIGGLYSDIKKSNGFAESESREITENRLESISSVIRDEHRFPTWTRGEHELYFSYFNRERIFRRNNTIAALDYQGEDLVGEDGDSGFRDRLLAYKEKHVNQKSIIGRIFGLMSRASTSVTGREWIQTEDNEDDIGRVLYTADVLVFTIPLDDFLKIPLTHGDAPPEYADIALIERLETETEYEVEYPDGETKHIREATDDEPGDYTVVGTDDQFTDFTFDFESLPEVSDDKRYCVTKQREARSGYMTEYKKIVKELESVADREIIWTVTMTDLHNDKRAQLDDGKPREHDRTSITRSNLFNQVYEAERASQKDGDDRPRDEFLKKKNWFDDPVSPSYDENDYKLLSKWVKCEYIEEQWDKIDNLMKRTGEEFVYPVWYDVTERDDDDELIIASEGGRILKCSHYLVDRIEGKDMKEGFVFDHPEYTKLQLLIQQFNTIKNLDVKSPSELAYEKMHRRFNAMKDDELADD